MTEDKKAYVNMDSSFALKVKLDNGKYVEVEGKRNIGV